MNKHQTCTISAKKISFTRAMCTIFANVSFSLQSKEILMVRGANGSGKTSLLRIIAGLNTSYSGQLQHRYNNKRWLNGATSGSIGWLGHKSGLKQDLSATQNLAFWSNKAEQHPEISQALQKVGLLNMQQRPVHTMSAGQKQRLALARLLLSNSPLWILDEPSANLDSDGRKLIEALLQQHSQQGGIAIIASHDNINPTAPTSYIKLEQVTAA
ncbi:MAG: heme ABC exporter ATP-binding protein CcmA [Robiginitomaculum sp.]|nr:heme ABC exporter ATP-binding protein CcmA [Robiginitomaculum sp.]